jgi:uncharacterized protein
MKDAKTSILPVVLIYLFTGIGSASEVRYGTETEALFWKIESESARVYLLGSIHLASDDFYPLPYHIENAFNESDFLVVEMDIQNIDEQEIVRLINLHGRLNDDQTLRSVIPDSTYEALKNEFGYYGLNILQYERMKPWVVAITLSQLQIMKFGFRPEYGIDLYFLSDARNGKGIIELETGADQITLFSDLSMELQILLLEDFLYDLTMPRERIIELFEAYRRWDAQWIMNFIFESVGKHPEFAHLYEKLLDERNIKMARKIDSFLQKEGTYFVVVGAGHLFGEMGIVQLLRAKGYETVIP